jgi:hypothetical protein
MICLVIFLEVIVSVNRVLISCVLFSGVFFINRLFAWFYKALSQCLAVFIKDPNPLLNWLYLGY